MGCFLASWGSGGVVGMGQGGVCVLGRVVNVGDGVTCTDRWTANGSS